MNTAKFRDWLEIIGVFGVVAALIFVGLQMKQTQDIAHGPHSYSDSSVSVHRFDFD